MRLSNVHIQQRGPISSDQLAQVYALADKLGVGIYLHGNSAPSQAVFTWNTGGNLTNIIRFIRALKKAGMR
jgi:hypothetical protein